MKISALILAVALALAAAVPASAAPITATLTSGDFTLVQGSTGAAHLLLGGATAAVALDVSQTASAIWPSCQPITFPTPCQPGATVNLSIAALRSAAAFYFVPPAPLAGPDPAASLAVIAGSLTLPPINLPPPNFLDPNPPTVTFVAPAVPFTLVIVEDVETTPQPILPGLVLVGSGQAVATFIGDASGWRLVTVDYTVAP